MHLLGLHKLLSLHFRRIQTIFDLHIQDNNYNDEQLRWIWIHFFGVYFAATPKIITELVDMG